MKITFVLPFSGLQGGVRVLAIYAEKLAKRGHELFVVSTPFQIPLRRQVKALVMGRGILKGPVGSHFDSVKVPRQCLKKIARS